MPLARLLSGHGDPITDHAAPRRERFAEHGRRCDRILEVLRGGRASAYDIARHLWSPGPCPGSRCSLSGKCSGTSTCCWTPAVVDGAGHRCYTPL